MLNYQRVYIHTFCSEKKSRLFTVTAFFRGNGEGVLWRDAFMEYTRCRDLAAEPGQPLFEVHRLNGGSCNGAHLDWENAWWIPGECWWPWKIRKDVENGESHSENDPQMVGSSHLSSVTGGKTWKNMMRPVMSNSRLSLLYYLTLIW